MIPALRVAARDAVFLSLDEPAQIIDARAFATPPPAATIASYVNDPQGTLPLRAGEPFPGAPRANASPEPSYDGTRAIASRNDLYRDGEGTVTLENGLVRIIAAPNAGGRAFAFEDETTHRNVFTTVGALRDDVATQPPLSTTDRIGKYTRTFPAGFFNRPYAATILDDPHDALVQLQYHAPDVVPDGALFERMLRLRPHSRTLEVQSRACFGTAAAAASQRAVTVSSIVAGDPRDPTAWVTLDPLPAPFHPGTTLGAASNGFGLYDAASGDLVAVTWGAHDVEDAQLQERRDSAVVRLVFTPHPVTVGYTFMTVSSLAAAREALQKLRQERGVAEANLTNAGEVAKWYTQSPQKRPSESSCGFESHLPQSIAYP